MQELSDVYIIFEIYPRLKYIFYSFPILGIIFFIWSIDTIPPKLNRKRRLISYTFFGLFFMSLIIYKYIEGNHINYIIEKVLYNISSSNYAEVNNKKLQDTSTVLLKKHLLGQSVKRKRRSTSDPNTEIDVKFRLASDSIIIKIYQDTQTESEFWVYYQEFEGGNEHGIMRINITEEVLLDDLGIK